MLIPVFVSAPSTTNLSPDQKSIYEAIISNLSDLGLEERRLGQSDYPSELPLREVIQIARRCSGGVVLGFVQFRAPAGVVKPGSPNQNAKAKDVVYPTAWNNLEAGILFSLKLPILVFKEKGVSGGVFDNGVTDVFVHKMPLASELQTKNSPVREVLMKWQAKVRGHYYEWEK